MGYRDLHFTVASVCGTRSGGVVIEDGRGDHCLSGFGAYPHLARRGSGEECVLNSPTLSPFLVKNVFICIK